MIVTSAEDAPRTILLSLLQRTLLPPTSNIITSIIILYFIWMFSIEASQVDVYGVNPTSPTNDPANLIQIQMTVATQKCLHYFTVDESTMHDNLGLYFIHRINLADQTQQQIMVSIQLVTEEIPSHGVSLLCPTYSPALPVDVGRDETDGTRQLSNIDRKIYMAFGLGLISLLRLLFRHLQCTVTNPPAPAHRPTLQYIRYVSLSSFGRMQEQKLDTLFECRFSGCKCNRYIEVSGTS
ncbi:hypothetical protein JR316_0009137 [Psilocybe cubensis]|uniref:Uncharacterized protein n=1 Tax=Psilocybe cubensis TaxID=181762 RepID=A0ACB8GT93_PSICU|nr:hypothetical protein JR316_0009137 [Psilocybe cubensis]KAH9478679.1 hypothetical protein JR316_0009137 [Psilocybe cubensis]